MRVAMVAAVLMIYVAGLKAQDRTAMNPYGIHPLAPQGAATDKPIPPLPSDGGVMAKPKRAPLVFLTRRKYWLASGGFVPNAKALPPAVDFVKDFQKRCPKLEVTDMQGAAEYAVTIDEPGILEGLTSPDVPTFRLAVYSRVAGLLYTGGTSFLKNAVKDACNAISTK
jgi:hypothetical protein